MPLNEIGDEFHVVMICDLYNIVTASFQCYNAYMSLDGVFVFIVSDSKVAQQTAKAGSSNILNR